MSISPAQYHPLISPLPIIDSDSDDELSLSPRDCLSPAKIASDEESCLDDTLDSVPESFLDSVASICKGANQTMVYGWEHCFYTMVAGFLMVAADKIPSWPIKKVFDLDAGKPDLFEDEEHCATTIEGRKINLIDFPEPKTGTQRIGRICKTALTNLVLENYKRKKEGLPLIPVLFCIDIIGNEKPCTMVKLTSKIDTFNNQITYKELRRAYKLCTHENPEIRQVAQETFKFVRTGAEGLELLEAPWADSNKADKFWKTRKGLSKSTPKPSSANWNTQLTKLVAAYDAERAVSASPSLSLTSENLDDTKDKISGPLTIRLGPTSEENS